MYNRLRGGKAMNVLSASEARIPPSIFSRVAFKNERIRVKHGGNGAALVLISEDDLAFLEELEDYLDVEDAAAALAEAKAKGEKPVPLADVKKDLGL